MIEKLLVASFAVVFALLPVSEFLPGNIGTLWLAATFALLLGTVFLFKVRTAPRFPSAWLSATCFAALGVVTASEAAIRPENHFSMGVQILFFMAIGPFAMSSLLQSSRPAGGAIAGGFLLGQSVSAGAAVFQAAGGTVFGAALLNGRASGLAGHQNILGVLSGAAFILALHIMMRRRGKLMLLLVMALNLAGLLLSGSISALIATVAGTVVLLIAARVKARVPVFIGLLGTGAVGLASNLAEDSELVRGPMDRIKQVTGQTSETATWDIRQNTYQFAWERIQRDPLFGRGLDDASGLTFDHVTLTHNLLLRSWMQGGLGMGAAFAIIYVIACIVVVRAVLKSGNALAAGLLVVMLGFALTSAALQQGYFWLAVLAAWALIEPPHRNVPHPLPTSRPTWYSRSLSL